jgi:hypothetical protein
MNVMVVASHPLQNGRLTHPQDIDAPLHIAAQRKINSYRQQYADNQNISFLPAILSTPARMHGEFCVFFSYRPTGKPRRAIASTISLFLAFTSA